MTCSTDADAVALLITDMAAAPPEKTAENPMPPPAMGITFGEATLVEITRTE